MLGKAHICAANRKRIQTLKKLCFEKKETFIKFITQAGILLLLLLLLWRHLKAATWRLRCLHILLQRIHYELKKSTTTTATTVVAKAYHNAHLCVACLAWATGWVGGWVGWLVGCWIISLIQICIQQQDETLVPQFVYRSMYIHICLSMPKCMLLLLYFCMCFFYINS